VAPFKHGIGEHSFISDRYKKKIKKIKMKGAQSSTKLIYQIFGTDDNLA
jgi:hypothetical protein